MRSAKIFPALPALFALAAGASVALGDFVFQQQCNNNWFGECSTTPCVGGGTNTFNNWGYTACSGGLPVPGQGAGVGGVVHIGGNTVYQNGDVTIASLDMAAGATLYIRASVSVSGQLTNTATVIADAGNIGLAGSFVNSGTWVENNGYSRQFNGATFLNSAGATLDWQAVNWNVGSGGAITNNGTISKTTGNNASCSVPMTNNGAINVTEGALTLYSIPFTSTAAATYTVPAGAIYFQNDTMSGPLNGSATGGGFLRWTGDWAQTGNVTLNISGNGFQLAGGNLSTGAFTLTNTGVTVNVAGNSGYAGVFNNQGTYWETNGYSRQFNAFTVNNSGTMEWQAVNWNRTANGGFYNNTGTTRKTTGNGATIALPVTNTGSFNINEGAVTLSGSTVTSSAGATYSVLAGAGMYFSDETISGVFNGSTGGLFRVNGGTALAGNTTFNIGGNGWEWSGSPLATNGFTLTNQNVWLWNAGNTGLSGTIVNTATGTLTDANGFSRQFNGATLTNNGTLNWQGVNWNQGSGPNLFTNNAAVVKTTGNTATIALPVVNSGSMSVQQGQVNLTSTVDSALTASYSINGAGDLRLTNATIRGTFNGVNSGTARLDGTTTLSANTTFNFSGNGIAWAGASLSAAGRTFTNTGVMSWISGNAGLSGTFINATGATMSDTNGFSRQFNDATLTNNGTVNLQGLNWNQGAGTNLFTNNAAVVKSTGNTATMALPVVNNGSIQVQDGLLNLTSTVQSAPAASLTVDASGQYRLSGATIIGTFNGASSGSAQIQGSLGLSGNTTLNISGNGMEWAGSLINTGAFTLTNAGKMVWITGNATLNGAMLNTGTLIDTISFNRQFNGFTLTNSGNVEWQSVGWSQGGPGGTYINTGTTTKTTANGAAIALPMTNSGLVDLTQGQTQFTGGMTQTAGTTRLNGGGINAGTLNLQGGRLEGTGTVQATINNTGGAIAPGLPVGAMTLVTNYTPSAGAIFEVTLAGTNAALYDHLQINGNATLNGVLRVVYNGGFNPIQGTTFRVLDVSGTRTGTFSSIELVSRPYSSDVQVTYDLHGATLTIVQRCGSADFNGDGDVGTDADIEAFFACLAGNCCPACEGADFNFDEDVGTDADIEAFFRVLAGSAC